MTLAVLVDVPLASGLTEITNTATVADDGSGGADLNPADNSATEQTPVGGGAGTGPDLVVTKDDGEVAVDAGDLLSYQLTVTNAGNQDASGVTLSDTVPEGTTFAAAESDATLELPADHRRHGVHARSRRRRRRRGRPTS